MSPSSHAEQRTSSIPFLQWINRLWWWRHLVARREAMRRAVRFLTARPPVDACLNELIQRESGWNVHATNPVSGAYGLPQALPGSKMASAGADWRDNPWTQVKWMVQYVNSRYGGSCAALAFQKANGYY